MRVHNFVLKKKLRPSTPYQLLCTRGLLRGARRLRPPQVAEKANCFDTHAFVISNRIHKPPADALAHII